MGRPERPLDGTSGALAAFARDLRALRKSAGNPSYRELARTALFSPSVLSSAASGHRLPTLAVTLAFVAACDADREAWERRWRAVAGISQAPPTPAERPAAMLAERSAAMLAERPVAEFAERPVAMLGPAGGAVDAARSRPQPRAWDALAHPAQLPMGASAFVGRGRVLASASHVIGQTGPAKMPLMISGPIGVGKSALALRLADDLTADFPDGQLYADLSACEPGTRSTLGIIRGFLQALGLSGSVVPDEPMQLMGMYRSLLAHRRVFVVLANVRDEYQVRPLLGRPMYSQVVMTSRARLLGLDGVHRINLDGFTRQESIMLLGRLVGAERVLADYAAADAVAELCEDLPLAVNIAGRMIAARPEWTIAYTAELLADEEQLLDSLGVGDVNMADRLTSAYQRLSPAGKQALHELGRNGAGWITAIGLATATATAVGSADDLLESLVDAGLLTRATVAGRYGVSRLVRAFGVAAHRDATRAALPLADRRAQRARRAPERRRASAPVATNGVAGHPAEHLMRRPIRACCPLGGYGA